MDKTHAGSPAMGVSDEKRRAVARPMTQMPAGPDYWPVPSQLATTRELAPKPAP
jgi:hypothetical protein